jgi:DNA invertase Pin-like site-specific DNA recombinase
MDRIRDLGAAGGISVVLAQDRDRFAREPAYHYLLKKEFEEQGTKLRALNDRGYDTLKDRLLANIQDDFAEYEREQRRGLLQARVGEEDILRPKRYRGPAS